MEFISRSERTKKTWQNPERRIKQSAALKKCWQREDYRARLTHHLREISPKGSQAYTRLKASGALTTSEETRKRCSEGQLRRLQRPEEQKKLEEARRRSFLVIDFQERAKVMHEAFLAKYGSFVELAKMGLKAPKRKPNRLELEVARMLGQEWKYVGKGDLVIDGLIPDFVHETKNEVLEVLGCYFHACPEHFPNVRISRNALPSYRESVYKKNGFEVTFIWEHEVRPRKLAFKDAGVKDPSVYAG